MVALNANQFAVAVLNGLGAPATPQMIDWMVRWEASEGGAWNNAESFNPLNVAAFDNNPTNSQSVMGSWARGIQSTINVINQNNMTGLKAGIMSGDPNQASQGLFASPWASSHYGWGSGFPSSANGYGSRALDDGQPASSVGNLSSGNTSVAQQTDAAGVSLNNSSVSAFQTVTPVLSIDALRAQSPLVAALVQSVPELQQLFQTAVSEQWASDKFVSALQNSNWWATHSDTARQAIAQMNSDPATWNQNVTNLQSKLQTLSAQYGSTASAQQIMAIAVDALTNGFDGNDAVLRQKFEQFIKPISGNHFGGEAGSTETQIRQQQMDLGVFLPENQLDQNIQKITGGQMSVNDVTSSLRSMAASMYPAYAQQINQGMNVSDIASPYTQRAQQLLEGGPGMLNIQSPLIKSALTHTANGVPTPMPLSDFETQVRQDPRWKATDNAQQDIMSTAHQVLQNFGFTYAGTDPRLVKEAWKALGLWILRGLQALRKGRVSARMGSEKSGQGSKLRYFDSSAQVQPQEDIW